MVTERNDRQNRFWDKTELPGGIFGQVRNYGKYRAAVWPTCEGRHEERYCGPPACQWRWRVEGGDGRILLGGVQSDLDTARSWGETVAWTLADETLSAAGRAVRRYKAAQNGVPKRRVGRYRMGGGG